MMTNCPVDAGIIAELPKDLTRREIKKYHHPR